MKFFLRFACFFGLSFTLIFSSHASDFEFPELTAQDLEAISKEYMGNFTHTSVSPARPLGAIWGVEAGIIAGFGDASDTNKVIRRADPGSDVDKFPHAALLGRVTLPYGVTVEGSLLPKLKPKNSEMSALGLGVQWNFFSLPLFHFALKGHFSTSSFEFAQEIGNDGDGKVEISARNYGLMPMASAYLGIFEPYIGLGLVRGSSDVKYQASAGNELFEFTDANEVNNRETSSHLIIGGQLNFLLLKMGVEYANLYGTDRYSAKLSLAF